MSSGQAQDPNSVLRDVRVGDRNLHINCIVLENEQTVTTKDGNIIKAFKIADRTGSMTLTLWDDQGLLILPGDIISLIKAQSVVFRCSLQLSLMKGGSAIKRGEFCMVFLETPFFSAYNSEFENLTLNNNTEVANNIENSKKGDNVQYNQTQNSQTSSQNVNHEYGAMTSQQISSGFEVNQQQQFSGAQQDATNTLQNHNVHYQNVPNNYQFNGMEMKKNNTHLIPPHFNNNNNNNNFNIPDQNFRPAGGKPHFAAKWSNPKPRHQSKFNSNDGKHPRKFRPRNMTQNFPVQNPY